MQWGVQGERAQRPGCRVRIPWWGEANRTQSCLGFQYGTLPPVVADLPDHTTGGGAPIGVKIALDPARVGTILGRCKTQHLSRRINLKSCCGDSPPLSILTASPDKPRRSSAGVRSTVALTCCAWRWPAALVACR